MNIVTTHYPSLKTLTYRNPQVRNASQEFDMEHLSPTYRLIDGIPGGSSALDIASRLGLEPEILHHARELIRQEDQDLDQVLQRLQHTYAQLEEERSQAHARHQEAHRLLEETAILRERFSTQAREERQRYRQQWQREFSKAQRQVNHIIEGLKKEKSPSQVQAKRRAITSIDKNMKEQTLIEGLPSDSIPKAGDRVEIDELGTIGILQEDSDEKKQVSIRVGSQTIKISPSAVRVASSSNPNGKPREHPRRASSGSSSPLPPSSVTTGFYQQELDLRGVRLEEALEKTIAALDQALMDQAKYVKIIHGQGSGVLKTGIRQLCQSSPYTENYRAGDPAEGGDGVTIVELR
jgi:DNA mismatch repair protein MutS2